MAVVFAPGGKAGGRTGAGVKGLDSEIGRLTVESFFLRGRPQHQVRRTEGLATDRNTLGQVRQRVLSPLVVGVAVIFWL